LDNAVKYGGNPPKVTVHAFARGRDRVVVRISDNGPGVPAENRRRIFQMFFRGSDELQRTKTGTGLGLYIVRTLVGFLKGSVAVADVESGTGSVFEITLPGRQLEVPESENRDARQRVSELALSAKENGP
jgi:signal transduction histidine kinase